MMVSDPPTPFHGLRWRIGLRDDNKKTGNGNSNGKKAENRKSNGVRDFLRSLWRCGLAVGGQFVFQGVG